MRITEQTVNLHEQINKENSKIIVQNPNIIYFNSAKSIYSVG